MSSSDTVKVKTVLTTDRDWFPWLAQVREYCTVRKIRVYCVPSILAILFRLCHSCWARRMFHVVDIITSSAYNLQTMCRIPGQDGTCEAGWAAGEGRTYAVGESLEK
jgi:hypothetical protein